MRTLLFCALVSCDRSPPSTGSPFVPDPEPPDPVPTDTAPPDPGLDLDGDGVGIPADCDDADDSTYPGAPERCDGRDNDCDGEVDPEELDLSCIPCDDAGWWAPTRGVEGTALDTLVQVLTEDHDCFSYSQATDYLFLNLDAEGTEIECVYTGRRTSIAQGKPDPTDMNTEHSWPQSMGADQEPERCDLHHLFPTDADTNGARSNYPFGEVVTDTAPIDGGSHLGFDASGTLVFEPRNAHKGNVARGMLYFASRYGFGLSSREIALYQSWSAADPVDDAELDRTLAIGSRQGAANPYVVCPSIVADR